MYNPLSRKGRSSNDEPPIIRNITNILLTWFVVMSFVIWWGLTMCNSGTGH